ncbi:polyamine ABC transporter substrate-binding protein [Herbiconiux flava]|uniref:Spermidine/putrescine transport system substrate-binding protein n=1 Tax=Herbiconiux flava TaxID=881268 RepID=A0A852SNT6_9MICO|nr:spermidine/putrescine ABC transporter substrate-binding protein [Herbiconiux flava]NYD70465.1 spermidine/putrescine transport system substrate-binding protein [Herbiconiux flava]GLK17220.1 spermidine/putrescine ABC transporter substrate-binding protein [Herbiconiux flava]
MRFRKSAAVLAGAAVTALSLSSCAGSSSEAIDPEADLSTQSLVVSIWADYYPETLAEDFEAETGIPVTIVNHATNEEIVAKLTASGDPGIDVAFVSGQYAQALNEAGLLQELEKSLIPNEENLYPEALELAYDEGNVYSEPYAWGTTGLCYRPDLTGFAPTSWNDLLNPRPELEGKTTMLSTERWMALPALKVLGESVNSTDPAVLEKVKEQMESTKDTLLAFDDTTFYSKLVSGEAAMVEAWDGWCNYAIAEDPTVEFVVPEEGSDLWVDTMTVLKSSKNKEAAMAFVNYILEADVQKYVAESILYSVPNKAAIDSLDPALVEQFPNLALPPSELLKGETVVDVGEFGTEYTRLATEIMAAG